MKTRRFPGLGAAGRRLVVVVLVGGCSSLTNAPSVSHDGGREAATHDGTGPGESVSYSDGAGNQKDSGSAVLVDARPAEVGDDTAAPAPGLDAAGGFGGAAGKDGGGGTAGQTGDALLASPDANMPAVDGRASQPDSLVVVDVALVNDRPVSVPDGPGEGAGSDKNTPKGDVEIVDTARPADVASTPLTVNAGPDQTICDGSSATIGSSAQGGTRPYAYAWSATPSCRNCITAPTSAQTDVVPSATTTFTVTAHDSLGAVATDSVTVTVVDVTAVSGPDVSVDPTAPVSLGTPALPGYTYAWTCDRPTCALSSLTTAQPTANPTLSTKYTVTVTSPEGCVASGSTMVWVNLSVSTTPKDGESAYPKSASLLVQFSAGVLASSISSDTVMLNEALSGNSVAFKYTYDPSLNALVITPTGANYNPAVAQYQLTLVGGATGIVSNDPVWPQRLSDDVWVLFTLATTSDLTVPTVVSSNPASLSPGVATNASVVVTYSETLDPTTVTAANFAVSTGVTNVTGALSYDAKASTITFLPAAPLATLTTYIVRVSGIKDLSGSTANMMTWTFTTGK